MVHAIFVSTQTDPMSVLHCAPHGPRVSRSKIPALVLSTSCLTGLECAQPFCPSVHPLAGCVEHVHGPDRGCAVGSAGCLDQGQAHLLQTVTATA